jgi:hypothetical protein
VETLTSRVIEGSEDVPVDHLQNFIQHSVGCFLKYLNKEPLKEFDQKLVNLFVESD